MKLEATARSEYGFSDRVLVTFHKQSIGALMALIGQPHHCDWCFYAWVNH
jgi:hypothetical protein